MSDDRARAQAALPTRSALFRVASLLAISLSLSACSTIDEFGPRSARYNLAAVDSRSRSILTNVLRAAYGKPLQFSDLTTATGQASLAGEVGLGLPFDVDPDATARTFTASPKISASGNSQFTVVSLNSKEFYQGLQAPISPQMIANLVASGYDPQLLLFLAISSIEIRTPTKRTTFQSNANTGHNYRLFYQAVSFLRQAGLSTRPGSASAYGPTLKAEQIGNPEVISTLLSSAGGELGLTPEPDGQLETFRLYRKGSFEFCFDPIRVEPNPMFGANTLVQTKHPDLSLRSMPTTATPTSISSALIAEVKDKDKKIWDFLGTDFRIDPAYFCNPPPDAEKNKTTEILISTRSVEGIFQFLGQIARRQLALNPADTSADGLAIMATDGSGSFAPFRVVEGVPANAALTVEEEGTRYSIITDASGKHDQTTRVLQLMTDLLALQSSAKDLPAPNLISIIGR
jgi:hypothetical protein